MKLLKEKHTPYEQYEYQKLESFKEEHPSDSLSSWTRPVHYRLKDLSEHSWSRYGNVQFASRVYQSRVVPELMTAPCVACSPPPPTHHYWGWECRGRDVSPAALTARGKGGLPLAEAELCRLSSLYYIVKIYPPLVWIRRSEKYIWSWEIL